MLDATRPRLFRVLGLFAVVGFGCSSKSLDPARLGGAATEGGTTADAGALPLPVTSGGSHAGDSGTGPEPSDAASIDAGTTPVAPDDSIAVDAGIAQVNDDMRPEVYGLAFGAGRFVATGVQDYELGVIFASKDGRTWSPVATNLAAIPWDVSFHEGRFVAVGTHIKDTDEGFVRTAEAYVSEDGETWTTVTMPEADLAFQSAAGNGVFMVQGETHHWRSSDGLEWTAFGTGISGRNAVAFANGVFLSSPDTASQVLVSNGTDDWETVTVNVADDGRWLLDVVGLNDRFVGLTAQLGDEGETYEWERVWSPDGRAWTGEGDRSDEKPPLPLIEDDSVCIAITLDAVFSGPNCESLEVTFTAGDWGTDGSFWPQTALAADGLYLVAGIDGRILVSTDGMQWEQPTPLENPITD